MPILSLPSETPVQTRASSSARSSATADHITEDDKYRLRVFEIKERQYNQEAKAIATIKSWVEATVDITLREINCPPDANLRTWYKNLKEAAGLDIQLAKGQVTLDFQRFMTPTSRAPKDLSKWVTEFETLMMKAQSLDIPIAKEAIYWFPALQQVTQPFLGLKLEIWKAQFAQEIRDNTLSFRAVANRIRFEISMDETLKKGQRGVKRGFQCN